MDSASNASSASDSNINNNGRPSAWMESNNGQYQDDNHDFEFPFVAWVAVFLVFVYFLARTIYKHRLWIREHQQRVLASIEAVAQEARQRRDFVQEHLKSYTYETSLTEIDNEDDNQEAEPIACPICMEDLKEGDKMAEGSSGLCSHKHFHYECMEIWLCRKNHDHCPMCRRVFMKEDLHNKISSGGSGGENITNVAALVNDEEDAVFAIPSTTTSTDVGNDLPPSSTHIVTSDNASSPAEQEPPVANSHSTNDVREMSVDHATREGETRDSSEEGQQVVVPAAHETTLRQQQNFYMDISLSSDEEDSLPPSNRDDDIHVSPEEEQQQEAPTRRTTSSTEFAQQQQQAEQEHQSCVESV